MNLKMNKEEKELMDFNAGNYEIKAQYGSASILKGNRIVFNLGGNKYRLVVKINFPAQTVFIRFVGTHKEYDKINAEEI